MYFIGEIGSNIKFQKDAVTLIHRLKDAGADAAKFQWISFEKLYGFSPERYDVPARLKYVWEKRKASICELSFEDLCVFSEECKKVELDFLCSVFAPDDVDLLDPLVAHHKLASCEISDQALLEALARSKKNVFVSTGAATDNDIRHAIDILGRSRVTLMYCDASYPSNGSDLTNIQYLQNKFGVSVGLSDHSLEVINTAFAAHWFFGAVALEKHVKLSDKVRSADSGHSITVDEFKRMVTRVKDGGKFTPPSIPVDILRLHKRRLIATKRIHKFDGLQMGYNCGYYRMSYDPKSMGESSDVDIYPGHFHACHGSVRPFEAITTIKQFRTINSNKVKLEHT